MTSTPDTLLADTWKAVAALTARADEYPCATDASEDHAWGIAEGIREVFRQIPIPTLLTRLEAMELMRLPDPHTCLCDDGKCHYVHVLSDGRKWIGDVIEDKHAGPIPFDDIQQAAQVGNK